MKKPAVKPDLRKGERQIPIQLENDFRLNGFKDDFFLGKDLINGNGPRRGLSPGPGPRRSPSPGRMRPLSPGRFRPQSPGARRPHSPAPGARKPHSPAPAARRPVSPGPAAYRNPNYPQANLTDNSG